MQQARLTSKHIKDMKGISEKSTRALLSLDESLPVRDVCERLVDVYITNFETMHRILHIPTLLREHRAFWDTRSSSIDKLSPFLAQLTSVLAVAMSVIERSHEFYSASLDNYLNHRSHCLLEAWLDGLDRKQRSDFSTLQTETLFLLAKQINGTHLEELWQMSRRLVRSAMIMGLHLDPSGSDKISFYKAESRRRLWITIVEIDIQTSFTSGMPLMISQGDLYSISLSNINDSEYDEVTDDPPAAKPPYVWTDSLAQISLAASIRQRIRIALLMQESYACKISPGLIQEVSQFGKYLTTLPAYFRLNEIPGDRSNATRLWSQALFDIVIRRQLLTVYCKLLVGEASDIAADQDYACQLSLNASLMVLSHQTKMEHAFSDAGNGPVCSIRWNSFRILCNNDFRCAALNVCRFIRLISASAQTTKNSGTSGNGGAFPPYELHDPTYTIVCMVQASIDCLIRSISQTGASLKDILLLTVALCSAQNAGNSSRSGQQGMRDATMKAFADCRNVLMCLDVNTGNVDEQVRDCTEFNLGESVSTFSNIAQCSTSTY